MAAVPAADGGGGVGARPAVVAVRVQGLLLTRPRAKRQVAPVPVWRLAQMGWRSACPGQTAIRGRRLLDASRSEVGGLSSGAPKQSMTDTPPSSAAASTASGEAPRLSSRSTALSAASAGTAPQMTAGACGQPAIGAANATPPHQHSTAACTSWPAALPTRRSLPGFSESAVSFGRSASSPGATRDSEWRTILLPRYNKKT